MKAPVATSVSVGYEVTSYDAFYKCRDNCDYKCETERSLGNPQCWAEGNLRVWCSCG